MQSNQQSTESPHTTNALPGSASGLLIYQKPITIYTLEAVSDVLPSWRYRSVFIYNDEYRIYSVALIPRVINSKTSSLSNGMAAMATSTVHASNHGKECPPDASLDCPIESIGSSISIISEVSCDVIQVCFLEVLLLSQKSHPISRSGSVGHEMSYQ